MFNRFDSLLQLYYYYNTNILMIEKKTHFYRLEIHSMKNYYYKFSAYRHHNFLNKGLSFNCQ